MPFFSVSLWTLLTIVWNYTNRLTGLLICAKPASFPTLLSVFSLMYVCIYLVSKPLDPPTWPFLTKIYLFAFVVNFKKKRVNEYHLLSANYKRVIVVVQGRWDLFPPLFSSFINIQKCIAGELKWSKCISFLDNYKQELDWSFWICNRYVERQFSVSLKLVIYKIANCVNCLKRFNKETW